MKQVKVALKTGEIIKVMDREVEGLRKAGLLADEMNNSFTLDPQTEEKEQSGKGEHREEKLEESEYIKKALENNQDQLKKKPIKQPAYKLPVLTTKQRRDRIKQAKKLKRQGYSQREIGRRLNVSHVAVGKWLKK